LRRAATSASSNASSSAIESESPGIAMSFTASDANHVELLVVKVVVRLEHQVHA
jgi:hypothetical protein